MKLRWHGETYKLYGFDTPYIMISTPKRMEEINCKDRPIYINKHYHKHKKDKFKIHRVMSEKDDEIP
jgi:hypothetical protein